MNVDSFRGVSLELALNSRVSTGGWKGIERGGTIGSTPLTSDQVDFVFWCLSQTPRICEEAVTIECEGKTFDRDAFTLGGERITLEPVDYPRIKCPSIRLRWVSEKTLRNASFSTADANAYLLEWGMGQEMLHVAGAIANVGVNMIGGVYVDLVSMTPYLSSSPPKMYQQGTLPEPLRTGGRSAIECIDAWKPHDTFTQGQVDRSRIGQLLWAGLGCTPHKTFRYHRYGVLTTEGQGKTIPSASATYTTALHVIDEAGVFKYVNWNEEKGVATHSLATVKNGLQLNVGEYRNGGWVYTGTNDLIDKLQGLVPRLPKASTYLVVASTERLPPFFSLMEAGYSILHTLLQAEALEMRSNVIILSHDQMIKIRGTIGLIDMPLAIIPISE
ncbi:MAG: hypothetical protein V3S97_06035 [Candidatus Bathyarchaeia archaeon]